MLLVSTRPWTQREADASIDAGDASGRVKGIRFVAGLPVQPVKGDMMLKGQKEGEQIPGRCILEEDLSFRLHAMALQWRALT